MTEATFWDEVIKNALVVGLGGTLVAIGNYAVRKIGKNSVSHERICDIEARVQCNDDRMSETDTAVRVLLSVNRHQNEGIRAVVEASKDLLNGSYERTVYRLDAADRESDEFLRSNYGRK